MKRILTLLCVFTSVIAYSQNATTGTNANSGNTNAETTQPVTQQPNTAPVVKPATTAPTTPAVPAAVPAEEQKAKTPQEIAKSNVTLDIELEGEAKFTFGVDLTSMNLKGERQKAVEGLRNDFGVGVLLTLVKNGTYTNGTRAKGVLGWIKISDLKIQLETWKDQDGGGEEKHLEQWQNPDIDIQARIFFGPFYIDVLSYYNSDKRFYGEYEQSIIYHDIKKTVELDEKDSHRKFNLSSLLSGNIDYRDGKTTTPEAKATNEHKGIALGAQFGPNHDSPLLIVEFQVASRFDWSTKHEYDQADALDGKNQEVPNEYDVEDPAKFRSLRDTDTDGNVVNKNYGHDWLLGGYLNVNNWKGVTANLFIGGGVGDWDKELMNSDFNIYDFKSNETKDPFAMASRIIYDAKFGTKYHLKPLIAINYGLGEYDFSSLAKTIGSGKTGVLPNTHRISTTAGLRFEWGSELSDIDLFGVNKERKTYVIPGVGFDLTYDTEIFNKKEYTRPKGKETINKYSDQEITVSLGTYEPASGGMVPYLGWAAELELYNIARAVTVDGVKNKNDWKNQAVPNSDFKNASVKWSLGLDLNLELPVKSVNDNAVFQPRAYVTVFENATSMKAGCEINLNKFVENTDFFVGWRSDRIFFNDKGKAYYGYTDSDYGVFFLGAKVTF